ncbi:MAG TPA: hypothetical protein VM489_15995 [Burkholderiales bacterium]|nr:hypothetical protein [Burkholderiales bacterium]
MHQGKRLVDHLVERRPPVCRIAQQLLEAVEIMSCAGNVIRYSHGSPARNIRA